MSGDARASASGLHHWLGHGPRLVVALIAAAFGAFGAFGQAPFDHPIAMLLSLAAGFILWRAQPTARAAGVVGWVFGAGYFAVALSWIVEPFQVDVARHGWMAPFALLFLSTGLALFWGAAFWLARRLSAAAIFLVVTWTGAEMLRAYIFTGFPWASPAQTVIDGRFATLLPLLGPHGATLCLMALAWALSLPSTPQVGGSMRAGQAALLAGAAFAFYLPQVRPPSELTGHWVRLIQPNAEQHLKWQPGWAEMFVQRQMDYTAAASRETEQAPSLIIWPETAVPWRLEQAQPFLAQISEAAGDVPVALGALRQQGDTLFNAVALVMAQGQLADVYDKHHLVPFGEYIPGARFLEGWNISGLASRGRGFGAGSGPRVMDFGALGTGLPLICYEAVFAHGVNGADTRPDFIFQVTNDAWFGQYAGPQQHLAQARMRAIEQGLPLMRAANTGISAMIDPKGRIIAQLPLGVAGFVDAPLPKPLNKTLYSRTGDLPMLGLLLLSVSYAAFLSARRRRTDSH
ncbi:MAG: apolipoprotein N-acyltransferase [Roseobacter sp.]